MDRNSSDGLRPYGLNINYGYKYINIRSIFPLNETQNKSFWFVFSILIIKTIYISLLPSFHFLSRVVIPAMLHNISVNAHYTRFL